MITKLYGPPGTGKTTALLTIMEEHLAKGVKPDRIGFVSFTQRAANEARERAMRRFGLTEKELPYFRTIHSLAFRQLALRRDQVVSWKHWKELGEMGGWRFDGRTHVEDGAMYGMGHDDRVRFLESLSQARCEPLLDTWSRANDPEIGYPELDRYARSLDQFKKNRALVDFNDMLKLFAAQERLAPRLDALIVDEAQDLSRLQWKAVEMQMRRADAVYVAGDDDQAIFEWSGASVETFLNLAGEVRVLDRSHRVPRRVHDLANRISGRIRRRAEKTWAARSEEGGIHTHTEVENVDLSTGEWLLLARNGYMLSALEQHCYENGFSFTSVGKSPLDNASLKAILMWGRLARGGRLTRDERAAVAKFISKENLPAAWNATQDTPLGAAELGFQGVVPVWYDVMDRIARDEATYYRAARRRGETLTGKPRISISTIHAAKGGEADNVLVLSDVSSKSFETLVSDPDAEHRVFYVAVTRAKQKLHLVAPRTTLYYEM